MVAHKIRGWRN